MENMEIDKKNMAFYARISGKVQGVGFRFFSVRKARKLGVKGWVRNISGGDVEVWAEGSEEALTQFFAWLHKGPLFARVNTIQKDEKKLEGHVNFSVTY
jgi:acylphosphatase